MQLKRANPGFQCRMFKKPSLTLLLIKFIFCLILFLPFLSLPGGRFTSAEHQPCQSSLSLSYCDIK